MKKCPFCAQDIQDDAIKCRFCGEFLTKKESEKWYFKSHSLVIAFLFLGPLALPLVWVNPRFSKTTKTVITIIVLILTYYLTVVVVKSLQSIIKYYQPIFQGNWN